MTVTYLFRVSELQDAASYDAASLKIDRSRREKLSGFRQEADRQRSLGAGLLLQFAYRTYTAHRQEPEPAQQSRLRVITLEELLNLPAPEEFVYVYGKQGKPAVEEPAGFYFSLSHSGDYVLCSVADREIGADIQQTGSRVKETMLRRVMTEKEIKAYNCLKDEDKKKAFYRCWTIKESYCKLTGRGLSEDMRFFQIDPSCNRILGQTGELKAVFQEYLWEEAYYISICTYQS